MTLVPLELRSVNLGQLPQGWMLTAAVAKRMAQSLKKEKKKKDLRYPRKTFFFFFKSKEKHVFANKAS